MPGEFRISESAETSYDILEWIGGGGSGQVFKVLRRNAIVACKQVRINDPYVALAEYEHMSMVKEGPHIAVVHDEVEWNPETQSLSIFMDYYEGKDLDPLVRILQATRKLFTENQIIAIAYQIAVALQYCHERNVIHQDIKPMNVLLEKSWNPIFDQTVPDLYVTDFGIASNVQTPGTRYTVERGTPAYEAPEIRDRGRRAAFSDKSDIYAFGCLLFRLCTLDEPDHAAGLKPLEISKSYSIELLSLISSMLSFDRDDRPTAAEVKDLLMTRIRDYIAPYENECRTCGQVFSSRNKLYHHLKRSQHFRDDVLQDVSDEEVHPVGASHVTRPVNAVADEPKLHINGTDDHTSNTATMKAGPIRKLCVVCTRKFRSRKALFKHLHYVHHWRKPDYVLKRQVEKNQDMKVRKRNSV